MNNQTHFEFNSATLRSFCEREHIEKLSLFGSVLHEDFNPAGDVDVLIEFNPGCTQGYMGLARIARELSALFGGRPVDARTPNELSKYFRDDVLATAQVNMRRDDRIRLQHMLDAALEARSFVESSTRTAALDFGAPRSRRLKDVAGIAGRLFSPPTRSNFVHSL